MKSKLILFMIVITGLVLSPFMSTMVARADDGTAEFGFTLGYDVDPPMTSQEYEDSLNKIKGDIDTLVANQQSWVRVGIPAWVVAWWNNDHLEPGTTDDAAENLTIDYYVQLVDYARASSLKVFLILTDGIAQGSEYTQQEYTEHMEAYWNFIATNLANKVDVIQIYNEAQDYHYRFYDDIESHYPSHAEYWAEMSTMFSIAGSIFKSVNPAVLITTNSWGFPANAATEQAYFDFFDAVADNLDAISLDLYPESQNDIDGLQERITNAESRYGKPVIVAEIGRQGMIDPGSDTSRSIEGQRSNMVKYMNELRQTNAMAVIAYELRDGGPDDSEWEDNFGIMEYNGDHKASFDDVMYSMRPTSANDSNDNSGGDDDTNATNDSDDKNNNPGTSDSDTKQNGRSTVIPGVPNTGRAK